MKSLPMVWIAVAAAVLFSGCIGYVPPLSREPISGREITARDAGFIVPGKTTRAEVVRTLGRGYRESPLIPSMAYPWELPAGTGFWFIFSTHHAAGDTHQLTNWRALFLAFDARGVVSRKEIVRLKKGRSLDEQLEKWAGWVPPGLPRVNP